VHKKKRKKERREPCEGAAGTGTADKGTGFGVSARLNEPFEVEVDVPFLRLNKDDPGLSFSDFPSFFLSTKEETSFAFTKSARDFCSFGSRAREGRLGTGRLRSSPSPSPLASDPTSLGFVSSGDVTWSLGEVAGGDPVDGT
jgi:hypothetical protein